MTWTTPALTFRCGACGTTATGFQTSATLGRFAADHARVCPGFPPSAVSRKEPDELPCGHPLSAVVTDSDLGYPGTSYCGACAERDRKEQGE